MGLRVTSAPTSLPIEFGDLRVACGFSDMMSDIDLRRNLLAAWKLIETSKGIALLNTTYEWFFRTWPDTRKRDRMFVERSSNDSRLLTLPRAPFSSVTKIEYYASGGANDQSLTTLATTNYRTHDSGDQPGQIELYHDKTWPALDDREDAVVITFVAGYGADASAVPDVAKHAIALLCRFWVDNPTMFGRLDGTIEYTMDALLSHLDTGQIFAESYG